MRLSQNTSTRLIQTIVLVVIAGVVIWGIWWLMSFRLVSVEPSGPVSPTISQLTFHFSRELDQKTIEGVEISPATNGAYIVNKNTFIFKPSDDLKKGKLTFTFKDITAKDGSVIASLQHTSTVEYVNYVDLSKEEQQRKNNLSSGGQDRFDLINGYLPHASYNYTLDFIEPLPDENTLILTVDVYGKGVDESEEIFISRMEQARKDVLQYIDTNKGKNTMKDFDIFYNNDYLSQYNSIPNEDTNDGG